MASYNRRIYKLIEPEDIPCRHHDCKHAAKIRPLVRPATHCAMYSMKTREGQVRHVRLWYCSDHASLVAAAWEVEIIPEPLPGPHPHDKETENQ